MTEPLGGWLGIDVGWIYPAADSDGRIYRWANRAERRQTELTIAGPVTIRHADGTVKERTPYTQDQLADVAARARTEGYQTRIHVLGGQIVSSARTTNRGLVLEDWEDFRKRRTSWTDLYKKIIERAEERGVAIRTVHRAYTSVTCPECGFVDKRNRQDRNTFRCVHCDYTGQADIVAARNMRRLGENQQRIIQDRPGICANPACDNEAWGAGQCQRCYFWRYRYGKYPTAEKITELQIAQNYREFCEVNRIRIRIHPTTTPKQLH